MPKLSRRDFLRGTTVAACAVPLVGGVPPSLPLEGPPTYRGDEPVETTLRVNGRSHRVTVTPRTTLVDAIREQVGLTGTKVACGHGACGACTVLLDGVPSSSCLALAVDAHGVEITTVEGLARGNELHPVQQAFLDADALQCGFCTPGMVVAASAFVDTWKREHGTATPTDDDVNHAMAGNICRCAQQPAVQEAVRACCAERNAVPPVTAPQRGQQRLPRVDGREKVTGAARYTVDVALPGMLHGAILRSPHAHAVVKKIDITAAKRMPGVKAVHVTLPGKEGAYATVRWVGTAVAAVAAGTLAQAQAACRAIKVEYEVRPAVVDWDDAEALGAPLVYAASERGDAAHAAEGPGPPERLVGWEGNVRGPLRWPKALPLPGFLANMRLNVEANDSPTVSALKSSDVVVDHHSGTAVQVHAPLEPHASVASWDGDTLLLHTSTQYVQGNQSDLAAALDIPGASVRVVSPYVGGAFGCKAALSPDQIIAAKLARAAGAPVKVVLTRAEELTVGGNRPGTRHHLQVGAAKDGRLLAIHHVGKSYCGAAVGESSTGMTQSHYRPPQMYRWDGNVVTHTPPSCPFRAPGYPPNAFALEQAVDEVAARLSMDPLLLRLKNETDPRRLAVYRMARDAVGDVGRLTQVAPDKGRFVRGVGCATANWFVITSPSCTVQLRVSRNGHVEVSTATHDMGQGARTVLAQQLHDDLGIPASRIHVRIADSHLTSAPFSAGSITTGSIANALRRAILDLKETLVAVGMRALPGSRAVPEGVRLAGGTTWTFDRLMTLLPLDPYVLYGRRGSDLGGFALPPGPLDKVVSLPVAMSKDTVSSAQVVEVEVDRLLGRTRVLRVIVALDTGTVMAPTTAASQVMGGVLQGVSFALYEERRLDRATGRLLTDSLESYAVLGMADAPRVEALFLDKPAEHSPAGCVGLGENVTIATSPAVANAVFRATGRRVMTTPISPAKLLAALS
jgi:xanthine dehydrogenase YagR molybdenum-binding subunit